MCLHINSGDISQAKRMNGAKTTIKVKGRFRAKERGKTARSRRKCGRRPVDQSKDNHTHRKTNRATQIEKSNKKQKRQQKQKRKRKKKPQL